ncbi:hypothetical protein HBB16_08690 [Pseudonocardia sp. MCCB 268]|nr:hypothetical protein [Pseudonocardia cytotoxica]
MPGRTGPAAPTSTAPSTRDRVWHERGRGEPACSGAGTRAAPPVVTTPSAQAVPEEIVRARAYLLRCVEPPNRHLIGLVERYGPVEAVDRVPWRGPREAPRRRDHRRGSDLSMPIWTPPRRLGPAAGTEDPQWPCWPFAAFATAKRADLAYRSRCGRGAGTSRPWPTGR